MRATERWLFAVLGIFSVYALISGQFAWREMRHVRTELRRLGEEVAVLKERQVALGEEFEGLGTPVTLYFLKETPTALQLGTEKRRLFGADLPHLALAELIRGPAPGSSLRPVLPRDTTLNSVKIRGGVAYADFGAGVTRLNVGSEGEAMVVAAIVNTLTQFPGVNRVQILVNGARVESLAGHVDVSAPLSRNETVVAR
ncbi:MAG: GerMN domain-containing protein [Bacillota bacterium]|nr:GerMN domain-containing protein [Bacillota bacterium]